MAEIIRMPRLSDTMEEGVIVGWLKNVGDKVEPGDILAEVETDKATMELESFFDGYLLHIGVEEGAVPVDGILAVIGAKDEDFAQQLAAAETENSVATKPVTSSQAVPDVVIEAAHSETMAMGQAPGVVASTQTDARLKVSPLARAMAREGGIDLATLSGTGDHGRIVKRDVQAALPGDASPSASVKPLIPQPSPGAAQPAFGMQPLSQMRKTIARRLSESKFGAPHFYLTKSIDMSRAVVDRKAINANSEVRISYNDMIIKACALALKKHPAVNSSWMGDALRVNEDVNIGVAVAVDDGLLVPVVRNAVAKSLAQIHIEVVDYAGRAREKKLQLTEMQGNTFTISNLGMFGIDEFTAIINPPDACIMAIGSIIEQPVMKDGQVHGAHIMKVTLSCDHRVVDGATGAQFLQTIQDYLETPVSMLV